MNHKEKNSTFLVFSYSNAKYARVAGLTLVHMPSLGAFSMRQQASEGGFCVPTLAALGREARAQNSDPLKLTATLEAP